MEQNVLLPILQTCAFFGIKYHPRNPHTLWVNGLVESKNKHRGCFIPTTTQKYVIQWSRQAETYTFADNTQTLTHSHFYPV